MDTSNKFMIGSAGADFVFMKPIPQKISQIDAMNLAAWIKVLLDDQEGFDNLVGELESL